MFRHGDRIVEERHQAVAGKVLDRALVGDDGLPDGGVGTGARRRHLLRVCRLGERGEPAQVAEERRDLPTVPGQEPLSLVAGEQAGHLWRESSQLGPLRSTVWKGRTFSQRAQRP
jgi:hypothetical protein